METSSEDKARLLSNFLALKVISEDAYMKLVGDEIVTNLLPVNQATADESSSDVIEFITHQLRNYNQSVLVAVNVELTDALILRLSLHIRNRSQLEILYCCFQCPNPLPDLLPDTESFRTFVVNTLWELRSQTTHSVTCQTLLHELFKEGSPNMTGEMIIRYFMSECSFSTTPLIIDDTSTFRLETENIRRKFVLLCLKILDAASEMSLQRITKWLQIDEGWNRSIVLNYLIERSNWINYSLLEVLVSEINLSKLAFDMRNYNTELCKYLKDFNILQFSMTPILSKSFLFNCYKFRLVLSETSVHVVGRLLEVKHYIAKKLNLQPKDVFINSVRHGSLIIELAIEKKVWENPSNSIARTLVTWHELESVYLINWDESDLLSCVLSDPISGSSFKEQEYNSDNVFSYSESIQAEEIGPSEVVIQTELINPHNSLSFEEGDDINLILNVDADVFLRDPPKLEIPFKEFRRIILKQSVPVAFCLIEAIGLPQSGKTTVLEKVIKSNVQLKTASLHERYLTRKKDFEKGLSMYNLCVLGGPPHNKYVWSYSTSGYGVTYSIICGLVRHAFLAGTNIAEIDLQESPMIAKNEIEDHFIWLMRKAKYYMKSIQEDSNKQKLLLNGLSLINILDVGVNKALYEFLPILSLFCRKSLIINFFSLERDGANLDEQPEVTCSTERKDDVVYLKQRSRLNYLLRFAAMGRQNSKVPTIMFATSTNDSKQNYLSVDFDEVKQKIQAKSKEYEIEEPLIMNVDIDDEVSLYTCTKDIQARITKIQHYQRLLPLRWVYLRSLVIAKKHKPVILSKKYFIKVSKKLNMNENEVDDFLTTFTDYGSILYMRKDFGDLVIVDIWEFLKLLDKLFYPPQPREVQNSTHIEVYNNLQKYGIITKTSIKSLVNLEGDEFNNFLKIITEFALVAKINKGKAVLINDEYFSDDQCYYIPRARVVEEFNPHDQDIDCVFIEINEINFPADIQTSICHEVMKKEDVFLIATEHFNLTQFKFQNCPPITIKVIYQGSKTILQIVIDKDDVFEEDAVVYACSQFLIACHNAFHRKINVMLGCNKYKIVIPCCEMEENDHVLYCDDDEVIEPTLCVMCQVEDEDNKFRHCWIKAAKIYNLYKRRDIPEDSSKVLQELELVTTTPQPQPSIDSRITPSRFEGYEEKVRKGIFSVLIENQIALNGLNDSVKSLADRLYQAKFINEEVKKDPSIDKIIGQFKASLNFMTTTLEIQNHCLKFLEAFDEHGPCHHAVLTIGKKWTEAVEKIVGPGGFVLDI